MHFNILGKKKNAFFWDVTYTDRQTDGHSGLGTDSVKTASGFDSKANNLNIIIIRCFVSYSCQYIQFIQFI